MLSVEDVLEILSLPLIGIVPESPAVLRASNVGSPITLADPQNASAKAYVDAAKRLRGDAVQMTIPTGKRSFFGSLFGRAA
jgi:septum site-determining protein MinD